jgi:hypothetical protein
MQVTWLMAPPPKVPATMQVTVVCPWFLPGPLQYLERRLHWLHRSVGQRNLLYRPSWTVMRGWISAWLCMCHSERHKEVQFSCKKQVYVFVLRSSTVLVACLNPLSILLLAPATPCDKLAVIPIYEKQQEQEEPHVRNWTGYLFGYFISPFFGLSWIKSLKILISVYLFGSLDIWENKCNLIMVMFSWFACATWLGWICNVFMWRNVEVVRSSVKCFASDYLRNLSILMCLFAVCLDSPTPDEPEEGT